MTLIIPSSAGQADIQAQLLCGGQKLLRRRHAPQLLVEQAAVEALVPQDPFEAAGAQLFAAATARGAQPAPVPAPWPPFPSPPFPMPPLGPQVPQACLVQPGVSAFG